MSALELAQVTIAARSEGLAVAAWLGEAGVAAATRGPARLAGWKPVMLELMVRRAEVMQARDELRRAGSNLNQLVRLAHTGGVLPPPLSEVLNRVLARIEHAVARADTAVAGIDELITEAGDELLSTRS
jgi:hypothetical protein